MRADSTATWPLPNTSSTGGYCKLETRCSVQWGVAPLLHCRLLLQKQGDRMCLLARHWFQVPLKTPLWTSQAVSLHTIDSRLRLTSLLPVGHSSLSSQDSPWTAPPCAGETLHPCRPTGLWMFLVSPAVLFLFLRHAFWLPRLAFAHCL